MNYLSHNLDLRTCSYDLEVASPHYLTLNYLACGADLTKFDLEIEKF